MSLGVATPVPMSKQYTRRPSVPSLLGGNAYTYDGLSEVTPNLELPFDILFLIVEASPPRTIVKLMYTCHALRDAGARTLVGRGVSLTTGNIASFVRFMQADEVTRFRHLRVLEIASGKLPGWAADLLLSLICHPLLALRSLTLREADLILASKPSPPEPVPSDHPPLLVTAFAGLTTLRHLAIAQCDRRACILVRKIRSPLRFISIDFTLDAAGNMDQIEKQNPIVLLPEHSRETLEEISGSNFAMRPGLRPYDVVYPSVRTLNATCAKAWPPSTLAYIAAFPNLSRLSLTHRINDSERRLGDASVLARAMERRAWNKRMLEAHTPRLMWRNLEEVAGSVTDILALGLACHVSMLRLGGTIVFNAREYAYIAIVLEDTQPAGLAIAVAGASAFCDTMGNVLKNRFARQLRTLEVELVFSPSEGDIDVQKALNDVATTFATLPLQHVTLTLNYGLLTAPDESYRAQYGWFCPIERDIEDLDVAATRRLFRAAIPSLVTDVVMHLSTDRTPHTNRLGVVGDADHNP